MDTDTTDRLDRINAPHVDKYKVLLDNLCIIFDHDMIAVDNYLKMPQDRLNGFTCMDIIMCGNIDHLILETELEINKEGELCDS